MPKLTNMTISKVYQGKSGEGKHGPWTAYSIYLEDSEGTKGQKKFGYFQSGKKPVPREGMKVTFMEYEIEKKGEYTNYNIKEIKFDQSQPQTQPEPSQGTNGKVYIDHGKVVLELMEKAEYKEGRLFDLITQFKAGIEEILNPLPEKPQVSEHDDFQDPKRPPVEYEEPPYEEPPPPEDDIPF